MKIVSLFSQVLVSLILAGCLIYYLTGYDSAFEADQLCHSYLLNISDQLESSGCDHDTETHQWILYETQDNAAQAKIIKKFRYKFL